MPSNQSLSSWLKSGTPWVWLTAGAVSISLIMLFGLITLIAGHALSHFWVKDIHTFEYKENNVSQKFAGEIIRHQQTDINQLRDAGYEISSSQEKASQLLVKIGNRELYGLDFKWFLEQNINKLSTPKSIYTIERLEWGNFYGYIHSIEVENKILPLLPAELLPEINRILKKTHQLHEQIAVIEDGEINAINYRLEKLRLLQRRLERDHKDTTEIKAQRDNLFSIYEEHVKNLNILRSQLDRYHLVVRTEDNMIKKISFAEVVRLYQPNMMSSLDKLQLYGLKALKFLAEDPREANTEGGVFPAIFGTIIMVLLMTVLVTPLGVVTAIYLHEYAKQGWLTRLIRVAVNNLAGIPSIVYGVFGLGFFVYVLGGSIDELFFSEALPAPTFGTPGLLWASLTLALLTLPVVIVSTEEGLSRIPSSIRDGALALGSTQAESIWRVILPIASPSIITGLILAVARAAGEVAPLMLVGVVKLAPSLAVDGNFPFLHLDRKLMHLGFHIYDVGFQSPNVEAARPLVYATAFLLIVIIVALNLSAIILRNRLRDRYRSLE